MITLNGKKFAEDNNEFVGSLFKTGGTCDGYAKRFKRHIKLYNAQNKQIGIVNKYGVMLGTREDGSFKDMDIEMLGNYSYSDKYKDLSVIAIDRKHQYPETIYQYK